MVPETRAVIIGGGVMGCALAYHLGRAGWRDVVLIEQHDLTDGTTWHTAGFVSSLRGVEAPTWHARLAAYLPALAATLRAETGLDAGWRPVGGLRLALSHRYVDELRRLSRRADELGVQLELRGASATMSLAPRLELSDVQAAAWLPGEGFLRPKDFVKALVAGAASHGVTLRTGVRVTGVDVSGGAVRGVDTTEGFVRTPLVIVAAGAASRHVGALAGVQIPVVPVNQQYGVTEEIKPALDPDTTPICHVPEQRMSLRAANGSVIVSGRLAQPVAAWPGEGDAPLSRPRHLAEPDERGFEPLWLLARQRMPELGSLKILKLMNGVEAHSPDGAPLAGPSTVDGLWVATGFGLHGMALSGGVARHLAEWIISGTPAWDLSVLHPNRFGEQAANQDWITSRALDAIRKA